MKTYSFTIILDGETCINNEMENKLYKQCNDALLSSRNGVIYLDFDRTAKTKTSAINSAMSDVQKAGYNPRLEIC